MAPNDAHSSVFKDDDIDRAARQMIDRHGDDAEDKARRYAELLMQAGDDGAWAIWLKIADLIQKLRSSTNR